MDCSPERLNEEGAQSQLLWSIGAEFLSQRSACQTKGEALDVMRTCRHLVALRGRLFITAFSFVPVSRSRYNLNAFLCWYLKVTQRSIGSKTRGVAYTNQGVRGRK